MNIFNSSNNGMVVWGLILQINQAILFRLTEVFWHSKNSRDNIGVVLFHQNKVVQAIQKTWDTQNHIGHGTFTCHMNYSKSLSDSFLGNLVIKFRYWG